MNLKKQKQIAKSLTAYFNSNFNDDDFDLKYDKAYENLLSSLYEIEDIQKNYDEDIAIYSVNIELLKKYNSKPIDFKAIDVDELIKGVVLTLKSHTANHLIIVPLQNAQFKETISFDNITLLPANFSRIKKLELIAQLSQKTIQETKWIADHTEKSRSEDFLKYPLMCLKQTDQTSTVHFNALNISKIYINSLRCLFYGMVKNTDLDKTSIFYDFENQNLEKASHLAIYAKENGRQNHKPLNFSVDFPYDLSWLAEKKLQSQFKKFINQVYVNGQFDDFNSCFLNAIFLFNDSIKQNNSISTIISMTIAESILTKNKNEKRLRISAIIPKLLKIKSSKRKEVSLLLNDLYQKRNNFVHSGEEVTINYDYNDSEPSILEQGRKIVAQLILHYPKFEILIEQQSDNNLPEGTKSRMKFWEKYVDSIFQEIIFGK